MKNTIVASAAILSLSLSFQSCKKHEAPGKTSYQIINITLDNNKSYQYNFGTPESDLEITKQSNAYLVSELGEANENVVFNYTPKSDFVGSDEIFVTLGNEEAEHHEKQGSHPPKNPIKGLLHHKHHKCEKHDEDKTVYIFRFTVNQTVSTAITNTASHLKK